jgi:hypothetical protein
MHINKKVYFIDCLQLFFTFFPLIVPIALYTFVLRARFVLGYFPKPNQPDPKIDILQNTLKCHYAMVWLILAMSVCSVIMCILLSLYKVYGCSREIEKKLTALSFIWILFFVWIFIDPGKFVQWFLD